ncbi:MAG: hypothetical protein GYB36_07520 [Alphaproteobacteria bacterium]|nr:hypothetical protein [Alphaproteobacteria bacterium]
MRRTVGDILEIALPNGFAYAQVSESPLIVFFDRLHDSSQKLKDIDTKSVAFKVCVHNADVKSGRWKRLGNIPISDQTGAMPRMFKQDKITGRLALYHADFASTGYERPARLSECEGLECAAVWDAPHVEDRLIDHFNGLENRWVKSLEIDVARVPSDQLD